MTDHDTEEPMQTDPPCAAPEATTEDTDCGDTDEESTPGHDTEPEPSLCLRGLTKRIGEATIFEDISVEAESGDMVVLTGPDGAGKTMLLLSALGRMAFDAGSGQVAGHELPRRARRVRDHTAVANVSVLTGLDGSMTVRQHIAERVIMNSPWYLPIARHRRVDAIVQRLQDTAHTLDSRFARLPDAAQERLGLVGRPDLALEPDTYVDSLNDLQHLVMEIVLACMSPATIVGVDDVDLLRTKQDRTWAWLLLLQLSHVREEFGIPGTTVITTCQETTELDDLQQALIAADTPLAPLVRVDLPGKES